MNKSIITIFFLFAFLLFLCISPIRGQVDGNAKIDCLIKNAISLSERALYNAEFDKALNLVKNPDFEKLKGIKAEHKIQLFLQVLRVKRFANNLFRKQTDIKKDHQKLLNFLPLVKNLKGKKVSGEFYLGLSSSFRSMGKTVEGFEYEKKALKLFKEIGDFRKIGEIRASQISRKHLKLFREGNKEKILALIPEYKKEIEFSSKYSKYVLSYNTRHLGQIHRRQTKNYKEALILFERSLSLRKQIGFKPFIPASYSSVGDVFFQMGENERSFKSYKKSYKFADKIGFIRYRFYPRFQIGKIFLRKGNVKKAKEYFLKALKVASEDNYQEGLKEIKTKLEQFSKEKTK